MGVDKYIKGRGAQSNPQNKFKIDQYNTFFEEGVDELYNDDIKTQFLETEAKSLVHKVDSPDVAMFYSANPYQGCEHGCIYCYARNSHQYWDYSSGLDFEKKILVKVNSPILFKKAIQSKNWSFQPIHLSGNTDCYQPIERKYQLTRQILTIALQHEQPISIITKNSLILRDTDILSAMAAKNLIKVYLSINSLVEETRQKLEPRTVTAQQRLKVVKNLSELGVPVGINVAPIIPGLTDHEIPNILREASLHGAKWANYIIIRLNGQLGDLFKEWLSHTYQDRKDKIWHAIESCHHGNVNNSNFHERMKGAGILAQVIRDNFRIHCLKNNLNKDVFEYRTKRKLSTGNQLSMF